MDDEGTTTHDSFASRLSRLLLPSLFVLREEHDQIDFRGIATPPLPANSGDVLRSFRPEIPATTPILVTRRHPGCKIRPESLHEPH